MSGPGEDTKRRGERRAQSFAPRLDTVNMDVDFDKATYARTLAELQSKLKELSLAYGRQRLRSVVVFEGQDAAGKGGTIRRMSWPLDPRMLKVWPISAPTADEKEDHYLARFWRRLPRAGQMVVFDRSWYGRVLVERVEGFASKSEWRRAYGEINEFERMLSDDGVRLVKIFLHITPDEQLARFRARFRDPFKRWKLSEEDLRNRAKWEAHETAANEMFEKTSTEAHPWDVIPANNKHHARIKAIGTIVDQLSQGVDMQPPTLTPAFEERAAEALGIAQNASHGSLRTT